MIMRMRFFKTFLQKKKPIFVFRSTCTNFAKKMYNELWWWFGNFVISPFNNLFFLLCIDSYRHERSYFAKKVSWHQLVFVWLGNDELLHLWTIYSCWCPWDSAQYRLVCNSCRRCVDSILLFRIDDTIQIDKKISGYIHFSYNTVCCGTAFCR